MAKSHPADVRASIPPPDPHISPQDRYYNAWATVGELVAVLLTCAAAKRIANRLETLSQAAFIPDSGRGNLMAAASLMAMSERGMEEMVVRLGVPDVRPGAERIIRFADIAKFAPPATPDTRKGKRVST